MRDEAVGRLAAASIAVGLAVAVWGATDLARSSPVLQDWFAFVLAGFGVVLVLSGVIALAVSVLRVRQKKDETEPSPPQIDITLHDSPGTIVTPAAPVIQSFGVQRPEERPSPSYWTVRPRTLGAGFVGRENDLQAVSNAFGTHDAIVISGGAGSGKSRLAAEYTHHANVQGFWSAAGSSVAETLVGLAGALGVRLVERADEEIAGEVQRSLAELPPETLWVVDNLAELELVNSLLSASGNVQLLVTTRDSRRHLLQPSVAYHWTEILPDEAAIDLLRSRSSSTIPSDHPALANMVEKVGRLPLALEMLAARLAEPRRTPESVLAQLERSPSAIQLDAFQEASGASIPRSEAESVFAAIAGTLEDLSADDRRALASLAYSAAGRIDDAIRLDEQTLELRERVLGPEHPDTLASRSNLANGYRAAGRNDDAIRLDEQTLELRERVLGHEHASTLASRNNLANGYQAAGRIDDAIRLGEQALETMERVLGPEHPDTLASRSNLASGYRATGRIDDAIRLGEQALETMERVLGPEHPDTLASRSNLANGYRAAGRIDDSIRLDEQTLELRERVLGPEHPDTLTSRSNLAIGYRAAGRIDDSIRLDEQTLELRERVLGPEQPDTLTSRSNLAIGYRAAGRIEDAERIESDR
jgi:tetratricopeptide (TPR) repeat protein